MFNAVNCAGVFLAIVFWIVTIMALYSELTRFTWRGLWAPRLGLCLVVAGMFIVFLT